MYISTLSLPKSTSGNIQRLSPLLRVQKRKKPFSGLRCFYPPTVGGDNGVYCGTTWVRGMVGLAIGGKKQACTAAPVAWQQ